MVLKEREDGTIDYPQTRTKSKGKELDGSGKEKLKRWETYSSY